VGVIFQFIYTMYVNVEQYYKQTIGMAVASVVAAILNLVLNYIFIPLYGYQVAAATTLVGYMVLLILHMLLVRRIGKNRLYPTGKIIITAIFVLIMMVFVAFLYQFMWLRYMIAFIYFLVIFVYVLTRRLKGDSDVRFLQK